MSNRILVFFEKEFNNAEEGDVLNDKEKVFNRHADNCCSPHPVYCRD